MSFCRPKRKAPASWRGFSRIRSDRLAALTAPSHRAPQASTTLTYLRFIGALTRNSTLPFAFAYSVACHNRRCHPRENEFHADEQGCCRTTTSPPKRFTPSRFDSESRPLRVSLPALSYVPCSCILACGPGRARNSGDFKFSKLPIIFAAGNLYGA